MTERVLGPGGRGVVVATEDPDTALGDVVRLRAAGVPATTPDEAGVRLSAPIEDAREAARFWCAATRRTTVATHPGGRWLAIPGHDVERSDEDGSPESVGRAPARVAVFGGAWVAEGEPEHAEAVRFGRLAAEAGLEVATGGYGGIMAAASRGAAEAGGTVLNVTIASFSVRINPWLTHEVEARDLFARVPLLCDAEAWVAFPGGVGTLAEVAMCWNLVQTGSIDPRPLVIMGERWDRALASFREWLLAEGVHFDLVRPAASADAAVEIVADAATR